MASSRLGRKAKEGTKPCLRWGKKAKRTMPARCSCSRPAKKAKAESTTMQPNWLDLPRDITANILQKLSVVEDIMSASQVCSSWWNIYKNPLMWRKIDMTEEYPLYSNAKLRKICRYAIDRSCGYLEDISIRLFATNDLLKYIAESTRHLRRLQLPECLAISDEVLIEVAKKLPLLEELDISYSNVTKDSLKAIGRSCPHLQALKFSSWHWQPFRDSCVFDEEALTIAETMPKLRRLKFSGNRLTDKGMAAVLDGCPLLEYLSTLDSLYCKFQLRYLIW